MAPRLTGRRLAAEPGLNIANAIWNLSLLGGLAALTVFDLGPNQPLTAMPWLITGGLAFAALIIAGGALATIAPALRTSYISLWFAGVAILGLVGMLGLVATVGLVDWFIHFDELPLALFSAFVERAIPRPLAPRHGLRHAITSCRAPPGRRSHPAGWRSSRGSRGSSWHLHGPRGPRRPEHPISSSPSARWPRCCSSCRPRSLRSTWTATTRGRSSVLLPPGPAAAAIVSVAFLLASSLLAGIRSLEDVAAFVGGTEWDNGFTIWTMAGLHARRPRPGPACLPTDAEAGMEPDALCGCDVVRVRWRHRRGRRPHGWRDRGGIARRAGDRPGGHRRRDPRLPRGGLRAFGLVAIGGLVHLADMFLLYTSARPVEYAVPGALRRGGREPLSDVRQTPIETRSMRLPRGPSV